MYVLLFDTRKMESSSVCYSLVVFNSKIIQYQNDMFWFPWLRTPDNQSGKQMILTSWLIHCSVSHLRFSPL